MSNLVSDDIMNVRYHAVICAGSMSEAVMQDFISKKMFGGRGILRNCTAQSTLQHSAFGTHPLLAPCILLISEHQTSSGM